MHASLIVPAPFDTVSGGYVYDRRIVAGLRDAGHTVQVVELAGSYPLADTEARNAASAAWAVLPDDTRPIIDGLALPAFADMSEALVARNAAVLIHHPTALETGLSDVDRAALLAIEKRLFPVLARVIVTSATTGESLAKDFGVASERIRVVVPGTDGVPRSVGSGGPTCRIISIGTLVPRKGHDVLLRAVARLFDLNWQLIIIGSPDRDPVHARTLVALAEELGIADRVQFAGEVVDAALEELWHTADLFALATNLEGYGMVVAEALKHGLPVAVCSGGAAGALVTPEAGVSCPPGDYINLSKALRRLIFGGKLRRVMADAAWQVGQTLPDWRMQANEFAQALAR